MSSSGGFIFNGVRNMEFRIIADSGCDSNPYHIHVADVDHGN